MTQSSYVDLCQLTFLIGEPGFPLKLGFLAAILNQSWEVEAVTQHNHRKRHFKQPHVLNEVSVTVYINVISYSLVCCIYYRLLVPFPTNLSTASIEDEAGSRPYNEDMV